MAVCPKCGMKVDCLDLKSTEMFFCHLIDDIIEKSDAGYPPEQVYSCPVCREVLFHSTNDFTANKAEDFLRGREVICDE